MEKKNSRRDFLKFSLTAGAIAAVPSQFVEASKAEDLSTPVDEVPFKALKPYLQTHFDNTMDITWMSLNSATGYVIYGESPENLDKIAFPESKLGLRRANTTLHKVRIENLVPRRTYYYRTITKRIEDFKPYALKYSEPQESWLYEFKNLDPKVEEFEFYMLNDIHDRPQSIRHLLSLRPQDKPDFIFFNGDIFDYQTNEQQISLNFLLPSIDKFASKKPFLFVRGNHETRGKFAREFPSYFKEVGYAAFSLGPARIVILDSGEDKADDTPVYAGIVDFDAYREEQALKLAAEINSSAFKRAKFRIVMMHIPPRYSGNWHGPKECTRLFEPLINKGKVDLVLSGHTHEYKVHLPNEGPNKYALVIGGGPKEGERTLTRVQISNKSLQVHMYDDKGQEVGQYIKNK